MENEPEVEVEEQEIEDDEEPEYGCDWCDSRRGCRCDYMEDERTGN